MNRRNFLKKIGITYATAVVAPTALVREKPGIDCNAPVEWTNGIRGIRAKHIIIGDYPYGIPYWVEKNRYYDKTQNKSR